MTIETCEKFLAAYKAGMEDESKSSSQRAQLKKNYEMMKKRLAERGVSVPEPDPEPEPEVVEDGDN